ncbi:MAG: hypothetical protein RL518_1115 [Pseudomonadota bacterium]|jgi:hypothetical protein
MSEPLIGTPGPFEVRCEPHAEPSPFPALKTKTPTDLPSSTDDVPRRRYECESYETCLSLAASLNWESFTCRGCCGQPNENLLWRARVSARKDSVAARLLQAPPIVAINSQQSPLAIERETSSAK